MSAVRQLIMMVTLSVVLALSWTLDAQAVSLIGTNPVGGTAGTGILNIQTVPFSVSPIGTAGGGEILSGLDFDFRTRTLFASSGGGGTHPGSLFRINLNTGTATLIGATGLGAVPGLAFDLDGTLFGSTAGEASSLIRINPSTGVGSSVGAIGFDFVDAIAVDPVTGLLYGVGDFLGERLISINKATGTGTSLGFLTDPSGALPPSAIVGLTFDSRGNLFGSLGGFPGGAAAGSIISIDRNTLKFTILGDAANGAVSDIAFVTPEPNPLILFVIGMPVVFSCLCQRRKCIACAGHRPSRLGPPCD
jgi:hypothetical protein